MTLALAIGGWTFSFFLMAKPWIEMDMRIQLEEAIQEAAIEVEQAQAQALRDCYEQECA